MRWRISSQYSAAGSKPNASRPRFRHSINVVPLPANGSSTTSPGFVKHRTMSDTNACGNVAGCCRFKFLSASLGSLLVGPHDSTVPGHFNAATSPGVAGALPPLVVILYPVYWRPACIAGTFICSLSKCRGFCPFTNTSRYSWSTRKRLFHQAPGTPGRLQIRHSNSRSPASAHATAVRNVVSDFAPFTVWSCMTNTATPPLTSTRHAAAPSAGISIPAPW